MNEKMMKEMTPQELEDFHKSFHDSADKWDDIKIEILFGMYLHLGLERINELTQEDLEWEIEKYARMKKYIARKERLDPFEKCDIAILLQNKEHQPLQMGMPRQDIMFLLSEAAHERNRRAIEKTRLAKEERMRNDPECAKRNGWW